MIKQKKTSDLCRNYKYSATYLKWPFGKQICKIVGYDSKREDIEVLIDKIKAKRKEVNLQMKMIASDIIS